MGKLSTLRSLCLRIEIKISCRNYNFSSVKCFKYDDILGLEPIVKHSVSKRTNTTRLLQVGKQQLTKGKYESAFEFLSQVIVMLQQMKEPMNNEVASCFGKNINHTISSKEYIKSSFTSI